MSWIQISITLCLHTFPRSRVDRPQAAGGGRAEREQVSAHKCWRGRGEGEAEREHDGRGRAAGGAVEQQERHGAEGPAVLDLARDRRVRGLDLANGRDSGWEGGSRPQGGRGCGGCVLEERRGGKLSIYTWYF